MEQFIGVYRIVSWEVFESDGSVSHPMGSSPRGFISYSAGGHMAVQIMNPDRPRFTSNDRWSSSSDEVAAAYAGYNAYAGRYRVNVDERYVIHTVECSLYPNRVGEELRRTFEFDGDRLTLSTPDSKLVWQRLE